MPQSHTSWGPQYSFGPFHLNTQSFIHLFFSLSQNCDFINLTLTWKSLDKLKRILPNIDGSFASVLFYSLLSPNIYLRVCRFFYMNWIYLIHFSTFNHSINSTSLCIWRSKKRQPNYLRWLYLILILFYAHYLCLMFYVMNLYDCTSLEHLIAHYRNHMF